ncbi:UNVERIFIED_CONTAM: hypothetical protein PYX00_001762 [Menopon gallinae]|uniref:FHA domain-containing protein n=1 Tax=Menopon gallinae TaxID=328185 RepID=A0AAW2IF21_9NEOP
MEVDAAGGESRPTEDAPEKAEENTVDDAPANGMQPAPGNSFEFKKPLLIGPRKGKIKLSKYKPPGSKDTSDEEKQETVTEQPRPIQTTLSPAELLKCKDPIPYKEPDWSGLPTSKYYFEVVKSGKIIEEINLSNKTFHVFGRSHGSDIIMNHPTVSRFHCVLQFRVTGDADNPPGYYIYDLGSINGTYLNKNRLKPNIYVRVQVGHLLKIGWSSRNYLLQGPETDVEPESELTITEMKELQAKRKLEAEMAEKERIEREELEQEERRRKEEEEGIDWGMGEDADEESDLSENPFATTQNEELYINDPKKTLRGWFEREGYDLEYNCEEKGFGQFVCRVELPIDNSRGLPVVAEAFVKGKKKEAVVQCALEACRILDQHGLLRQSNHESRKRKAKNWEDNDYYDSDEDTFLDRTGTIEKKRKNRMEQAGVKSNPEVHTYQSLIKKHDEILKEIKRIEKELEQSTTKTEKEDTEKMDEDEDALDAYMSSLSKNQKKDNKNISKLKSQLASLKQEELNVRNLANVAKPAEMPKLKPIESQTATQSYKYNKLPIIGKRKTTTGTKKPVMAFKEKKQEEHDSGEEVDSD